MLEMKITGNISDFARLMRQTPDAMADGLKLAMHDIKKDWHDEAHEIAPLDTGRLRSHIKAQVDPASDLNAGVTIESNAMNRGFNYAYYIHENDAGGKSLRTPGTVKKYLDRSADKRVDEWIEWIEDDVKRETRARGW